MMNPARRPFAPALTRALRAACLLASFGLASCSPWHPHGAIGSFDEYTYYSLPHQPQTVTLVDTRSGEKLWTCEIPVGQQLSMRFVNTYDSEVKSQDTMRWSLFQVGRKYGTLENKIAVPPASSRRVDVTMRPGPEYHPKDDATTAAAGRDGR